MQVPFDKTRLVFPLLPAAFVAVLLYMIFSFTFNLAELRALYAGGILGYITYEMIHYYLHHGSPPPGSYFAGLKSHHVAHHYINPKRGIFIFCVYYEKHGGSELTVSAKGTYL